MRKRTASILKWVGVVSIGLGFAYGALHLVASRTLQREYDALRAEGRPMIIWDIVPREIPAGDNAALVYNAAIKMLEAEPLVPLAGYQPRPNGPIIANLFDQFGDVASRTLEEPTNAVAAAHVAQLLREPRVTDFLASIERGSARPGYWQKMDYSKGAGLLLPHVAQNRNVSRVLSAVARQQAADGNSDAAWRTAVTGLRVAAALRDEPIIICQLVRVAQLHIASSAVRAVAETSPPAPADSVRLEKLLESFESREPLVRSLDGERLLWGEWAFKLPASEIQLLGDSSGNLLLALSSVVRPLRMPDHAAYLRVMHGYSRNAAAPYAPGDRELGERMLNAVPRYCILTRMLAPTLSSLKAKFVSMNAAARVMRVGLAAIRYRQDQGAFPPDLQSLRLANTDDPFTGKPLLYRTTDRGFTIYSVGMNLTDDGGVEGKDSKTGDVVWRYAERTPAEQPRPGDVPKAAPVE